MRIAAVYDIHGNLPALEAVLNDVHELEVEHIVVGGDVVAGPMPVETLNRLQAESTKTPISFIHGNAESEVLRCVAGQPIQGLSPVADDLARWVTSVLRPEQIEFLSSWQTTVELEGKNGRKFLFCHATPQNDIDVFTEQTPDKKVRALLGNVTVPTIICGHTHMQFERFVGNLQIVNAGSVGMPFGHTGAAWLLIDESIAFKRTEYHLEKAAARIEQTNYPQAKHFAAENVLKAPTVAQASALLIQLESQQASSR
ncbi:MAG: metallophosphoesterase family protein [Chloroflexota bacterium]